MKGVIYCYHCISTGKKYIGKTKNEKIRKRSHRYHCKKGIKNNFYNAVRKYGWQNFIYGIINEFDILLLEEKEIYYIDLYDTYCNGYNSTRGGEGGTTWLMPEEIKEQYRQRMIGYKHSEEAKKKISEANSGRKWSEEAKRKLSEKCKGRKPTPMSDEAKNRLSLKRKGIPRPQSVIEKMMATREKNQSFIGKNNPNSKKFVFISPEGNQYVVQGGFKKFCEDKDLSCWGMKNMLKTGKIVPSCKNWIVKKYV